MPRSNVARSSPSGLCDSLGKLVAQCDLNGFCITGNVLLPLAPVLGASYMAGDGVTPGQTAALFGWADNPPPVTAVGVPLCCDMRVWTLVGK